MTKRNVLLIASPNVSLFMKKEKPALGLGIGAGFVAGSIEHNGFELDYFDFNFALNSLRQISYTPTESVETLYDLQKFLDYYHGFSDVNLLQNWVNALADKIDAKEYFSISLSLDRPDAKSMVCRATLTFSILLARELKKRFKAPIFLGGKECLSLATEDFLHVLKSRIQSFPIDQICKYDAYAHFGKFLVKLQDGLDPTSPAANAYLDGSDKLVDADDILPRFHLNNMKDLLATPDEIFPFEIQKTYPEIREIQPFFIAPYKFSEGCPFTCAFCTDGMQRSFYQFRAEKIVDKLYHLTKKGISNFAFFNNNINLNRDFLNRLETGMRESGVKIRFTDSANLQNSSAEMFQQLARIGAIKLWFGTETVSERLLKIINKNLNKEKIIAGLKNADAAGIFSNCNFIFNFPHETQEEFDQLHEFISNCEYVNGYDYNEFRLVDVSAYRVNPQKFGIELVAMADTGRVGSFNEIGRYQWNERIEIGRIKAKRIDKIKRDVSFTLSYNDHAIFALRSIGFDKPKILQVLRAYTNHLRENRMESEYGELNKYSITSKHFNPKQPNQISGHAFENNRASLMS